MPARLRPLPPPMVVTFFHLQVRPLPHPRLHELQIFHPFLFPFQHLSLTMRLFLSQLLLPMSTRVHNPLPQNYLLDWQYPNILLALATPLLQLLTIESMVQGTTDLQLLLLTELVLVLGWVGVRTILKQYPIQTQFLLLHPIELRLLCLHPPRSCHHQLRTKKWKKNRI
jgi:hypothetical protein